MTIDYLSDLHFEAHLGFSPKLHRERFKILFGPVFETKKSDTLIVAGDIGEHNDVNIQTLRLLRDEIGYKNILLVLWNHDLFLSNRKAIEGYGSSVKRVEEMKELCDKEPGIHLLDGNIVEIDGFRIGGAMGWYDAKYILYHLNPYYLKDRGYINRLWKEYNPDFDNIIGIEEFDSFCAVENAKVEAVFQSCDVIDAY